MKCPVPVPLWLRTHRYPFQLTFCCRRTIRYSHVMHIVSTVSGRLAKGMYVLHVNVVSMDGLMVCLDPAYRQDQL